MMVSMLFFGLIVGFIAWREIGQFDSVAIRSNLYSRLQFVYVRFASYTEYPEDLFRDGYPPLPGYFQMNSLFLGYFYSKQPGYFQMYFQKSSTFGPVSFALLAIRSNRTGYFQTIFRPISRYFQIDFQIYFQIRLVFSFRFHIIYL